MENAIYNSMNTAIRLLEKQAVISNNLANISTTGFKEKFNFIIHSKNIENSNKVYSENIKEYYNFSPGSLTYTNRNLDLFINKDGWIAVKDKNGHEAYTKNGHIKINSKGKLTVQNYEVIGNNCSINIPNNIKIKILSNGKITEIKNNRKNTINNIIGSLKLVRLSKKNVIQKENGLFYCNKNTRLNKNYNSVPHDKNIHVKPGFLEESNVNSTKNMIDMISNAREFEMQMNMISICNKNAEYANQLLNTNN